MNSAGFLLAFSTWLAQTNPSTLDSSAPDLKVMTFNIRYGTAADGEHDWNHRRDRVIEIIQSHGPHVLALQEALLFQLDELMSALPQYRRAGEGRDGLSEGEHCAVLFDTSRAQLLGEKTFWLSETPEVKGSKGWDAALPRICTLLKLEDLLLHRPFVVANTHLDHQGESSRLEGARAILRHLKEAYAGLPMMVTGDLNCGEDQPPTQCLRDGGFRDSFRVVHPDAAEVGTFNGFEGRVDGSKIDYVLIDSSWTVAAAEIVRTPAGSNQFASDHDPVTAVLRWPEPVAAPKPEAMVETPAETGEESPPSPPAAPKETVQRTWMPVLGGNHDWIARYSESGASSIQDSLDHAVFRGRDGAHLWTALRKDGNRAWFEWRSSGSLTSPWTLSGLLLAPSESGPVAVDWPCSPCTVVEDALVLVFLVVGQGDPLQQGIAIFARDDSGALKPFEEAPSPLFLGAGVVRHPCVLSSNGRKYLYYTGTDPEQPSQSKIYARVCESWAQWSEPIAVNWAGGAGSGPFSAECPLVLKKDGFFYLFRTTSFSLPLCQVYRSTDPLDFGTDTDAKKIGTIKVAAPELVVDDQGREFFTSVCDSHDGVELHRILWAPEQEAVESVAFVDRFQSLWDFEDGTLQGWVASGEAFASQPTYAHNGFVRNQWVGPQGHFYVGTYEKRPNAQSAEGEVQADEPKGELRSPSFELPDGMITFLMGGGKNADSLYLALHLEEDNVELVRATGTDSNFLDRVIWNVAAHKGRRAYLLLVDRESGSWGHINFDDIRIEKPKDG